LSQGDVEWRASLLGGIGKRKGFEFNHKIRIKVQESPPNIMVIKKPMVCESSGKRLVVQEKDASPLVHPT
jgi:hypothetical protein